MTAASTVRSDCSFRLQPLYRILRLAVAEDPADLVARAAYHDWLEDNAPLEAEFIRLHTLYDASAVCPPRLLSGRPERDAAGRRNLCGHCDGCLARAKAAHLLERIARPEQVPADWLIDLDAVRSDELDGGAVVELYHGLPAAIVAPAADLFASGRAVCAWNPIVRVEVYDRVWRATGWRAIPDRQFPEVAHKDPAYLPASLVEILHRVPLPPAQGGWRQQLAEAALVWARQG